MSYISNKLFTALYIHFRLLYLHPYESKTTRGFARVCSRDSLSRCVAACVSLAPLRLARLTLRFRMCSPFTSFTNSARINIHLWHLPPARLLQIEGVRVTQSHAPEPVVDRYPHLRELARKRYGVKPRKEVAVEFLKGIRKTRFVAIAKPAGWKKGKYFGTGPIRDRHPRISNLIVFALTNVM